MCHLLMSSDMFLDESLHRSFLVFIVWKSKTLQSLENMLLKKNNDISTDLWSSMNAAVLNGHY